jgi:hypothetical protein
MEPVYCNHCGATNIEGAAFCAKCGRPIRVLSSATGGAQPFVPINEFTPAPAGRPRVGVRRRDASYHLSARIAHDCA